MDGIWVAVISFAGTLIGTLGGIMASAKLISYRIEQLEKKVDMHNDFAHRIPVIQEQITEIARRVEALEKE